MRVALTGLEIWSDRDKIRVEKSPTDTLNNFLQWRSRELLPRLRHDNAQLVMYDITPQRPISCRLCAASVTLCCVFQGRSVRRHHGGDGVAVLHVLQRPLRGGQRGEYYLCSVTLGDT